LFGRSIRLFNLLGFEVKIDFSWVLLALLIAWSLSTGFFPLQFEGLSTRTYWVMGIVGALGLFVSIIAHEFSHSLVARRYGMPMKGITLFLFGGVAEMSEEPARPGAEFAMAVAGPLLSFAIAGLFYGIYRAGAGSMPSPVAGVVAYLAWINAILGLFNLVPAFPLDGGRMLRAVLWRIKGNLNQATRIASQIGSGFGVFLIILGIFGFFGGNFLGGLWWVILGLFIQGAAKMSYQRLVLRKSLAGEPVRRFMNENPVTVDPAVTLRDFVEDYVYHYHFKMFPVVENGDRLVGCITTRDVKGVPREAWNEKRVGEVMEDCGPEKMVAPDQDAMEALSVMNRNGVSRLMVGEGGRLVGIVSLKDMMKLLSLKVELDG